MSTVAFIEGMVAAGFSYEDAMKAARVYEQVNPGPAAKPASPGAERTRRWRERKEASQTVTERHETSQTVTTSQALSPSPSPQTPQPRPHTRGDISPARKGRSKPTGNAGFDEFWEAYPLKVAKDAALPAFAKAMARIDDPDPLAVILAGIRRALPGWTDPKFIPHAATWLNRGQWADQLPANTGLFAYDPQPANDRHPRPDGSQSRAARDQSAALRVLARRGLLGGPDGGGGDHDGDLAGPAAVGG